MKLSELKVIFNEADYDAYVTIDRYYYQKKDKIEKAIFVSISTIIIFFTFVALWSECLKKSDINFTEQQTIVFYYVCIAVLLINCLIATISSIRYIIINKKHKKCAYIQGVPVCEHTLYGNKAFIEKIEEAKTDASKNYEFYYEMDDPENGVCYIGIYKRDSSEDGLIISIPEAEMNSFEVNICQKIIDFSWMKLDVNTKNNV